MIKDRDAHASFCATMTPLRMIFFVMAATLLTACNSSPKAPNAAQKNYPVILRDSADSRAKAEREWRRMLDAYTVPQTPPDLHPIINTPRSLLGVTGGIKLMAAVPERGGDTTALREAMRGFLDRWRDLLNADPSAVSLAKGDPAGTTHPLTYRQANYGFPVAGKHGGKNGGGSSGGRSLQIYGPLLPPTNPPPRPPN